MSDPDPLADRVAALEAWQADLLARQAAAPRAAPPITIGPFTNVPAPGSPIRSDWPQTITNWIDNQRNAFGTPIYVVTAFGANSRPFFTANSVVTTTDASAMFNMPYGFTLTGGVRGWSALSGDSTAMAAGFVVRYTANPTNLVAYIFNNAGNPFANRTVRIDYCIWGWQAS